MNHFLSFSWFLSRPHLKENVWVKWLLVAAAAFWTKAAVVALSGVSVGCSEILKWNEGQRPGWPERDQPSGSPEFLRLSTTTTLIQVASTLQPFVLPTSCLIFLCWSRVSLLYWSLPRANQCGSILYCSCRWRRVALWKRSSTISLSTLSDNNAIASSLLPFNFHRFCPNACSDARPKSIFMANHLDALLQNKSGTQE